MNQVYTTHIVETREEVQVFMDRGIQFSNSETNTTITVDLTPVLLREGMGFRMVFYEDRMGYKRRIAVRYIIGATNEEISSMFHRMMGGSDSYLSRVEAQGTSTSVWMNDLMSGIKDPFGVITFGKTKETEEGDYGCKQELRFGKYPDTTEDLDLGIVHSLTISKNASEDW